MSNLQQGDVYMFNTVEGGNIQIENGVTTMSGGLETTAYLSMFGGNEDDDLSSTTINQWWGNGLETDPANTYRSETQHLMTRLPATSSNLLRLEEAAGRDVAWMKDKGLVTSIAAEATIPELNRVMIALDMDVEGEEIRITFLENWKADI